MLRTIGTLAVGAAAGANTTVEIAPGVFMPVINIGGVSSKPSNYSLWLELGGRGLDTARSYGDAVQREVGSAMHASGLNRSDLFLTTKIPCCPFRDIDFCKGRTPATATEDLEADLQLLGVEYVDLMLLHWPCANPADTLKVYQAMEAFHRQGKARTIGISNFNASAIDALLAKATVKPAVNQCGFSIANHGDSSLGRDLDTLQRCKELGITYEAYSPLGGLSGIDVLHDPDVEAVAQAHNRSTAQVALRWISHQGAIAVTASTSASHDLSDMAIFDFDLTEDEVDRLTRVGGATFQERTVFA